MSGQGCAPAAMQNSPQLGSRWLGRYKEHFKGIFISTLTVSFIFHISLFQRVSALLKSILVSKKSQCINGI